MSTKNTQIKITLPQELKGFLDTKAMRLGLPVASYIRHLIIKDVEDIKYPVYKMSTRTEKIARKAMADYKAGKSVKVDNIQEFFDDLQ
jgi:predicted DNA-binding protein